MIPYEGTDFAQAVLLKPIKIPRLGITPGQTTRQTLSYGFIIDSTAILQMDLSQTQPCVPRNPFKRYRNAGNLNNFNSYVANNAICYRTRNIRMYIPLNLVVPEVIQRAYRDSDPSSYISAVQMTAGAQSSSTINGEEVGNGPAGEMFFSSLPSSFFQTDENEPFNQVLNNGPDQNPNINININPDPEQNLNLNVTPKPKPKQKSKSKPKRKRARRVKRLNKVNG